jgi:hypothetical protein
VPVVEESRPRSERLLGWAAIALVVVAAVALVVPLVSFVRTLGSAKVALDDGPVTVRTAGGRTWGVIVDDRDNSGYSESCSVSDRAGRPVALRNPGATVSSSDTETLDHVFTTPADGRFTVACSVRGATVRVGPVASLRSVATGVVGAALLGLAGLGLGLVRLRRRSAQPS